MIDTRTMATADVEHLPFAVRQDPPENPPSGGRAPERTDHESKR
jgi:hypothetical protein